MLIGFLVIGVIVAILTYFSFKKYQSFSSPKSGPGYLNPIPLSTTFIILGIGLGGFIDGIIFHQILQWHGMFTNQLPAVDLVSKSVNMYWDGIFHLFTLTAVIIGVVSLTRLLSMDNINISPKLATGGFITGWGLFNFIEGLIHHHILEFHNVKEFSHYESLWNYGFLASGVIFIMIGFYLIYQRPHFTTIRR